MTCRKSLLAAGIAAFLVLGSPAAVLAHGPDYGGGNPQGWHHGWHQGWHMDHGMRMQGCPGGAGYGMGGPGMMGPGMMGQGMMGPGMMGPGMMGQGMMGPGMQGPGMGQGVGPGGAGSMMQPSRQALTVDDVKDMLERRLAWQGNPHVKLGNIEEKDEDTILAEIVTQDGSLVQRLEVDRRNGWTRMVR